MKKLSLLFLVPVFALFMHSSAFAGMTVGVGVSTGPLSFSYNDGENFDHFGGRLQLAGRSHSGNRHSGHGYRGHSSRRHSGHGYRGHSSHRYSSRGHGRHYGYSGRNRHYYGYLGLDILSSLLWPFSGLAYGYPSYGYPYGYSYPYNYPYYGGGYYNPGYRSPPPGYYGSRQNYGGYGGSNYNSSRENNSGEYDYQAYSENPPAEYGGSPYDFRTFHEKRADEEKRRRLSLQSDQEN